MTSGAMFAGVFDAPSEGADGAADDAAAEAALEAAALLGADEEDEPEEQAARPSTATQATAMYAVIFT
jgi:hypothetical protein